jgi:hypothetical protein
VWFGGGNVICPIGLSSETVLDMESTHRMWNSSSSLRQHHFGGLGRDFECWLPRTREMIASFELST